MSSELLNYAHLGELRSVIPSGVNVLALTATARLVTLRTVEMRLSMLDVAIVALPPERANIFYTVEKKQSLAKFGKELANSLCQKRLQFSITVIFCQQYQDCADMYRCLRANMGQDFTEPVAYPDLHRFRLVDTYVYSSFYNRHEGENHFILLLCRE